VPQSKWSLSRGWRAFNNNYSIFVEEKKSFSQKKLPQFEKNLVYENFLKTKVIAPPLDLS
jgi:hypothetical protein